MSSSLGALFYTINSVLLWWMWLSSPAHVCSSNKVWLSTKCQLAHIFLSCRLVKGTSLECNLCFGLLDHKSRFREHQFSFWYNAIVQTVVTVVTGAQPYQDSFLLSGQQVVVIPVCSCHWERPEDASLLTVADAVVCLLFLAHSFARISTFSFSGIPLHRGWFPSDLASRGNPESLHLGFDAASPVVAAALGAQWTKVMAIIAILLQRRFVFNINHTVVSRWWCIGWPNSKPCLFPYMLSIWPPYGTVLTGGKHNDLSLILAVKCMQFASFGCSWKPS